MGRLSGHEFRARSALTVSAVLVGIGICAGHAGAASVTRPGIPTITSVSAVSTA